MNARFKSPRSALWLSLALLSAPTVAEAQGAQPARPSVGQAVEVPGGRYWNISVQELQTLLAAEESIPLVNTHIPYEGDIVGTDASIPFNQIADHLDQLPADKNAPIVLYCRTGPMSVRASTTLAGLGYTQVFSLVGGFNAWAAAGLPMVRP